MFLKLTPVQFAAPKTELDKLALVKSESHAIIMDKSAPTKLAFTNLLSIQIRPVATILVPRCA